MAILTKFLQLLKPERNDYVDVEKHLSENYDKIDTKMEELSNSNDKKLDKGAVSSEYDTAKKIEDKIKTKLNQGNVPDVLNSAEKIIKALQGNTGIKFDENLLYLNDSGTKKKGYCYIDKLTDGIFECIQETTTTVNNATYFKNFSNKENSDRLSNLEDYCDKMINGDLTDFNVAHYETLVEYLEKMKQENKLHKVMYINVDTIADLSFLPERTEHELVILYYGFLGVKALCCSDRSVFLLQSWNNHDYKTLRYKQLM